MKKLLALLLAAVLCLSFAACGDDSETVQPGGDGDSGDNGDKGSSIQEETEFVLCQEWIEVKSGRTIVVKADGTYASGDSQYPYTYDEKNQAVYLNSVKYDIVRDYGVYMLVFNEDEYYVSARNYEPIHDIFVQNGKKEIADSGTVITVGETNRLKCGTYFTVDKVELDAANTVFYVYLTCKNNTDEGCGEFESVKGNWVSMYLGCPFDLTAENSFVDRNATKQICLEYRTNRLTAEKIQSYSEDSYGYLKLYFSASKETYYIDMTEFFGAK